MYEMDIILGNVSDSLVESASTLRMVSQVQVSYVTDVESKEVASKTRHSIVTPEHLSRTFNIGLGTAKRTLQITMQKGIRIAIHPIHRRYCVDHLNIHQLY